MGNLQISFSFFIVMAMSSSKDRFDSQMLSLLSFHPLLYFCFRFRDLFEQRRKLEKRELSLCTTIEQKRLHLMHENMKIESKLSEALWKFPVSRQKLPSRAKLDYNFRIIATP